MLLSGGLQSIPPGTSLRVRFDVESEAFLTTLTNQIVESVGVFQAQMSYSVTPFHIKLVELPSTMIRSSSNAFYSGNDCSMVYSRVLDVANRFYSIQGQVIPQCYVNPATGEVSLRIKSADCMLIGRQLANALPGSNDWCCKTEENLLVSIGTFRASHKADFEVWLNKELSNNDKTMFPLFVSSTIEFSEEWLAAGIPQQIVMLTGLRPFSTFEPFGGSATVNSTLGVSNVDASIVGGVLGAVATLPLAPSAAKVNTEESGSTSTATAPAVVDTAPRPVWGIPVGGGIPERLRDAGLNGEAVVAAKSIPARSAAKPVATAAVSASATNGTTSAAIDSKDASTGNWTCPSCKLMNFPRRNVCLKCHTPKPEQCGVPHLHPRKPIVTPTKPDGDIREGDWICSSCKGHNFASKIACFTCRASRPGVDDHVGEGMEGSKNSVPARPSSIKPGDWTCPKCKENVFAHRSRCYKCTTLKPSIASSGSKS